MKHVTGYTGFNSSVPDEQEGHYLALAFEIEPNETEITVELIGGTKGPVKLDADRNIVLRIKDKDTQSVKITGKNTANTVTKTYHLNNLIIES